ncbi:MAG: hypothetical protein H7144_08105 [Burkholderiales bacterium]|nr:hypothetical protein [Phycisphaerae bacterium]
MTAVLVSAVGLVKTVEAKLVIDLRFLDGTKNRNISVGSTSTIPIRVWAVVTGDDLNTNREGLQSATLALQSRVITPGISGSITSAFCGAGWTGSGSSNGWASNLTPDGVGDWGKASPTQASLDGFFRARTNAVQAGSGAQINFGSVDGVDDETEIPLPNGGREFLVGRFVFKPSAALLGGVLRYDPVTPPSGMGGFVSATWWEDSSNYSSGNPPDGGTSPVNGAYLPDDVNAAGVGGVEITVIPEPAAFGVLLSFLVLGGLRARPSRSSRRAGVLE